MDNKFWKFQNEADGVPALMLYGDIADSAVFDEDVTPQMFEQDMAALGDVDELKIYINSGGGSVFAGMTIYNILKRHRARKTVYVDGIAASIASLIAMAGDEIVMAENAMMMIHEASALGRGNKRELRRVADALARMDDALLNTYAARTGKSKAELAAMLEAETWMTAREAVENGFADRVETGLRAVASIYGSTLTVNGEDFDIKRYKNPPEMRNAVESVEVVYGPPCSGKSTYAREHMGKNDVVYDYDRLIHAMTTQGARGTEKTAAHEIALGVRGLMIARAHEETPVKKAFILTRWPTDNLRRQLAGLNVTETRMEADMETCLARLEADAERTDKPAWAQVIRNWFADHGETDHGGESQPVADREPQAAMAAQRRRFAATRRKILDAYYREDRERGKNI